MVTKSNCAISLAQVAKNNANNIGEPMPPFVDLSRNMGWLGSFMSPASALARVSEPFRRIFDNTMEKVAYRNLLMDDHEDMFAKMSRLPAESRDRLNAVLEYLRLSKTPVTRTGRKFSIKTKLIEREGKDGINRRFNPALSKPGDVLSLTKEETEMLHDMRDWLDSRYTLNAKSILENFGYDGEYSLEAIQALPDAEPGDIQFRDSLLRLYNAIESQRLTSYIPFMRSGDVRVMVYGPDGTLDTGAFYMLNSRTWLKNMVGPKFEHLVKETDLNPQIRAIQKKYPASEGFTIQVTRRDIDRSKQLGIEDLGTLDKLLSLMEANSGRLIKEYFDKTLGGLVDTGVLDELTGPQAKMLASGFISDLPSNIKSILMEQVAAGFMKQSRDIAGYDTNFINRMFDYNRIVATTVSHRKFRKEYSLAKDEAMSVVDEPERKYIKAWDDYVDTPEHAVWKAARGLGFFNAMWGSFSSGMVAAMSTWTVVAPQMTVMKAAAGADIYAQSVKVMAGMRGRPGVGFLLDPYKIPGLTQKERDALVLALQRGTVRAQINPELMGMEAGFLARKGGNLGKTFGEWYQIGGSVVSVMEEIPKYSAFLTAYRYAQDPKALANWKEAFKDNARARAIMEKGSDPFDVAEFMVETTTFIGGQIEKPPILRGPGGVILQFSQYPLQMANLLFQNFARMGNRGRVAGMFTVMTMWSAAGLLFGIPFGDDAINIFEWLYNKVAGEKRDFRTETQLMLAQMFGGTEEDQLQAEALMYGPFRSLLGINVGERIGFSSMLPELGDPVSAIPALSTTIGKFSEAYERYQNDQPIGAAIAALSPFIGKGPSDVAKAFIQYPNEGYRTRYDSIVKAQEDIDAGDKWARAFGFQSADFARRAEARRAEKTINESTRTPERRLTIRLSKIMAEAIRADEAGDMAKARRLEAEFEKIYTEAADRYAEAAEKSSTENDPLILANAVKPPSSQVINEGIRLELYPELSLNNRGKTKRAAISAVRDTIMAGETEDDVFADQEEEELLTE